MAILRRAMKSGKDAPVMETHLDADTLAAFAEHSQRKEEEAAVFAHLAECEICREYLAINAELKNFDWNTDEPRRHALLRLTGLHSIRTTIGIACAAATLCFLFLQPPRRKVIVATSKPSGNNVHVVASIEERPTVNNLKKPLAIKPGDHFLNAPALSRQSAAIPSFTRRMPDSIEPSWENVSLQNLTTDNRLIANQFLKKVTLASFSFNGSHVFGRANAPATNQIALMTTLGERWITVKGFQETTSRHSKK